MFDYDMEPAPYNVPLVGTTDSDTLFDGHKLGWYDIDCRDVVAKIIMILPLKWLDSPTLFLH